MNAPLLHIALFRPLIPQNTGTIGRLALALGVRLHLVHPLGFRTDEKACRRAGLDYWREVDCLEHADHAALLAALPDPERVFMFSARAERLYTEVDYRPGDCLLFGDEERGLPQDLLDAAPARAVRIPVRDPRVRSLNLANAASIAVYEALRQLGFPDVAPPRPRLQRAAGETTHAR
ncbi:MAG: tRNA (cytidine(34)-2'-O)-methyltransferase [Planctomycetes bacterium]|nr:tRNA (cytidine(34)-2'-O)-methyltransferase [Planctomycetota bacterium]